MRRNQNTRLRNHAPRRVFSPKTWEVAGPDESACLQRQDLALLHTRRLPKSLYNFPVARSIE